MATKEELSPSGAAITTSEPIMDTSVPVVAGTSGATQEGISSAVSREVKLSSIEIVKNLLLEFDGAPGTFAVWIKQFKLVCV